MLIIWEMKKNELMKNYKQYSVEHYNIEMDTINRVISEKRGNEK